MGRSGKYTVIAVLGVVVAIGTIFFTVRSIAGGVNLNRTERRQAGGFVETSVNLEETVRIEVEGVWKVRVMPAENGASVELSAPEDVIDEVISRSDSTLRLVIPPGARSFRSSLEATVYTDSLEELSIEGASSVELEDLSIDALLITIEGAGSIEAEDLAVQTLTVNAEGAANVDFMDSSVANAQINIEGAAKVDLMMGGGFLEGSLEGIGKVRYRGEVSKRNFSIDGLGSIEYLD